MNKARVKMLTHRTKSSENRFETEGMLKSYYTWKSELWSTVKFRKLKIYKK